MVFLLLIISQHQLGDAWVIKASELTNSSHQIHTKTHLAHLLNVGDSALGFDFANANCNDDNVDKLDEDKLPDVVRIVLNIIGYFFVINL